jgi:hypothetical protein
MVAEPGHERSGNPRGYGNEPGWDAATPAGRAEIGALIAGRIDAAAEAIHRRGGQGLILWDGEGRDGTGGGYHGDPRRALLADEALPALDAAFARVRARGLEPGVLVATDLEGLAGCADLVDRLAWARERWGIGLAAINNLPAGLDLRLVAAAVPQVRLITVEGHPMARDAGYAYRDRADGAAPDRTAILVHGDDAPAALAAALAGGAMVLLPAWYQSPELDLYDRVRAGP